MDFWRRAARKSRNITFPYSTIRAIIHVEKTILVVTEEKRLRWFGYVKRMTENRLPRNPRMETTRNTKVRKAQRKMNMLINVLGGEIF